MLQGKYSIRDSDLRIDIDRGDMSWESSEYKALITAIHEKLLSPIYGILAELGYAVEVQKGIFNWPQNRYARKGDLRLDLLEDCGTIKVNFFQNINAPQRPDNGGRYEWDKVKLMPYLMRLEMKRTMNRIIHFIQKNFDFTQDLERIKKNIGIDGITTVQWLDQYTGEYDDGLKYVSNTESADKQILFNGARVWFYDRKGRLKVGVARYNINSMWWVTAGKYYRTNEGSNRLYMTMPHSPREKKNSYERRAKMSQEAFNQRMHGAIARANKLDALIQKEYGDTGLWITRNQAREYFVKCGLSYEDITKYKFNLLRKMVDEKIRQCDAVGDVYKVNRKTKFKENKAGLQSAYIGCQASYFSDREAINFWESGEIGFAGWAGHHAVKPILEAFVEWCDKFKKLGE